MSGSSNFQFLSARQSRKVSDDRLPDEGGDLSQCCPSVRTFILTDLLCYRDLTMRCQDLKVEANLHGTPVGNLPARTNLLILNLKQLWHYPYREEDFSAMVSISEDLSCQPHLLPRMSLILRTNLILRQRSARSNTQSKDRHVIIDHHVSGDLS